jgi:midasin
MGESGTNGEGKQGGRDDEPQDTEVQAFKKLGDTLESWYSQQRQIRQARERPDQERMENLQDADFMDIEFEHLPDDVAHADTQALGTATQDQAIALDERNAVHMKEEETAKDVFDGGDQEGIAEDEDVEMFDAEPNTTVDQQQMGTSKAFIGDAKSLISRDLEQTRQDSDSGSELEEVDTKLSTVNLSPSIDEAQARSAARKLWSKHEANTRPLAAMLTEQLRLILAPTLATKLRGDFRTGKRLNIKRIIPYIASSYKRDKIWMRRSVPSKRSYQLMIALDDSKSMSEGGSQDLAFETLALIMKALAMLEAGEICVVGFGSDVKVHHPFERPFTDDAGADVFSGFEFNQQKTDVRKLVAQGIQLFQAARARASGSAAELWQLMLIVSDGICEDHEGIKRLVRRAQEERIMIVFVVVDAGIAAPKKGERITQTIMELQTAEFIKDENGLATLVRRRYMESFPFRWWLVVRDISELPGVLAMALRQWFAEVVDASG